MKWQRVARLTIAVAAIAFVAVAASTLKRRMAPQTAPPVPRTDPTAVIESAGGHTVRISGSKEDGLLQYERLLTYANGSSKMVGVSITSQRNGKTFVLRGKEGQAGENDATFELNGNVKLEATDGMVVTAERATYVKADNLVQVPGAASFARGRTTGSGIGLNYDQLQDVITIGDRAVMEITPDDAGKGGMTMAAGALEFRRVERIVRLDRQATITREQQTVSADQAVAHLNEDESGVELLELRNNARIVAAPGDAGALQSMSGRNVDLRYRTGSEEVLERAVIDGDADLRIAGDTSASSRQIAAGAINIGLGMNGTTPVELAARNNVRVTLPGEGPAPTRTIASQALDSNGAEPHGLTGARFSGNVQFSERGAKVDRAARSALLDVTMSGGFGTIDEATFTRGVRFADGPLLATSAIARYSVARGTLELSGSEAGSPSPHVVNDRITIDSTRVELVLEGPIVHASGSVKSVLQPAKPGTGRGDSGETHLPSMLKEDQPVNVTSDHLDYDGTASRAVYKGSALLWQADTSIKGASITIDSTTGDVSASGPVATSAVLLQDDGTGKKERIPSIGTAHSFAYEDTTRKATYTGDAHLTGPQGDVTSPRVELFLLPSGDELDRAEAYDGVTLRSEGRKTTGQRLTYFSADQRYLVTGTPVTILEECGRETVGRTLTFFKLADRIIVDGNEQIRTQTRGKSNCP